MNMLATVTPTVMLIKDGQNLRFKKDAARAPVQAPVPGRGMETNISRPSQPHLCILG